MAIGANDDVVKRGVGHGWIWPELAQRHMFLQGFKGERVDALAFGLGDDGNLFVQFGRDPQVELA